MLAAHNTFQKRALVWSCTENLSHTLPLEKSHYNIWLPFWIWLWMTCFEPFKKIVVDLGVESSSHKGWSRAYLSQQRSFQLMSINFWAGSESQGTALAVAACFLYCSFYTPIIFLPAIPSKLYCLRVQGNISERWGTVSCFILIEINVTWIPICNVCHLKFSS